MQKVSTSNDDDDPGSYEKPNLDCIIGASLLDDMGANSAVLDRIIRLYRSWHSCRAINRSLGHSENLRTIPMARPQTKPKTRVPALSSNG